MKTVINLLDLENLKYLFNVCITYYFRQTTLKILLKIGFEVVRITGSHHRFKHPDGRITTIPIHGNDDIPKGLLRKIIREDLLMTVEEFNEVK
ncbi:MAG: type II toxin-antitoxin system HicA family toxin [Bacteroidetes bacterium]|nr:type II toxin-antitoxin system HicA family toxin [Bacteroidota bacterium]